MAAMVDLLQSPGKKIQKALELVSQRYVMEASREAYLRKEDLNALQVLFRGPPHYFRVARTLTFTSGEKVIPDRQLAQWAGETQMLFSVIGMHHLFVFRKLVAHTPVMRKMYASHINLITQRWSDLSGMDRDGIATRMEALEKVVAKANGDMRAVYYVSLLEVLKTIAGHPTAHATMLRFESDQASAMDINAALKKHFQDHSQLYHIW